MAQFDALRDAFNGFNNMLLDSQQWDEKHKAREADREYKHTILRGDMMQREFQNNMAKNDYKLRERGEDRLADSLQFTQKMQLEDQKMRIAADGRDQKKAAATLRQMEQELVTGSVAAAEAEKMTDPSSPFDVNGLLSPEQLQNPSIMENLNKHTGQQYGFLVGEDGIGRNADEKGTPFTMAKIDQKDLEPYILGLVETYDDKFGNALDQKLQLTETIKTAKATAKSSDSIYTGQQRGMANAQKNRAEAELRKVNQFFSPRGQMQFQQQEIANLTGIAGWNRERNNESAARAAETKALRHMDALEALRKGITNPVTGGKDTDIWATELKDDGSAQWLGKGNFKDNQWTFEYEGQLVQGLSLAPGTQAVKPTEFVGMTKATGGGSEKERTGGLSGAGMTDFSDVLKIDGMTKAVASQEFKGLADTLSFAVTMFYDSNPQLHQSTEGRQVAREHVLQFKNQTETEYWFNDDEIDSLIATDKKNGTTEVKKYVSDTIIPTITAALAFSKQEGNGKQQEQYYTRLLATAKNYEKGNTKVGKDLLQRYNYATFEMKWRELAGDSKLVVYPPKKLTRELIEGRRKATVQPGYINRATNYVMGN